jgi:uncharacterized DUF497 family protein
MNLKLTWDEAKRAATLLHRGLDFADVGEVFAGAVFEFEDNRHDYGERRINTFGWLRSRMVAIVWTQRGETRRIISMRYANEREVRKYEPQLG